VVQALDIEDNCLGVYFKQRFHFDNLLGILEKSNLAWKHSSIFDDETYTYLSVFAKTRCLSEYSSNPELLNSYQDLLESQKKAAMTAKVDLSDLCFFDVLPDHLMQKWFSLRDEAMINLVKYSEKPSDYDILHKIHVLTTNISKQKISADGQSHKIVYDMYSSATGRLATMRGSFPILSISKENRKSVLPKNDMFLELDLNGAEIRTLLSLCGKEQPDYDIHEFNKNVAAQDLTTRQEVKARFFAWLYNPEAKDYNLEKLYNKNIYKKHYKNGHIETPFGRKLEVDERKALNYLTQSTTSDIVLENAYKIMKFLKGKKSFVAFTMHDSVVLDFCKEEHSLVQEIKDIFETNMFGKFLSTVNIGKNYGNLKEIKI
jgi:DNA polymerase I-like protein with 3'-5' exonuclease and polymerase domains